MGKFKIALDCDNIINNFTDELINAYNNKYNANLTVGNFVDYDFFKCFPYDDATRMVDLLYEKSLWDALKPIDGAQRGIRHFIEQNYEVYFATATEPENFPWKVEWLKSYFNMVPSKNIICINNKGLLKVDVLIDDNVENLLSGFYHRVCLDYTWNRHVYDEVYDIIRCNNWDEIVKKIDDIYQSEQKLYH